LYNFSCVALFYALFAIHLFSFQGEAIQSMLPGCSSLSHMRCHASMVYAGSRFISSIARCSIPSFPVSHHTLLFHDIDKDPIKTRPTLFREDLDRL
jgi:hypothetical protein